MWDGLDHDQQEAWAIYGTYPGYDWMPDGKRIVIWAGGKINAVDVATLVVLTNIPFTAHVKQTITNAVRSPQQRRARQLRREDASLGDRLARWAPRGVHRARQALGEGAAKRHAAPRDQ